MIEFFDVLKEAPIFTLALGTIIVCGLALYAVIVAMKILQKGT